MGSSSSNSSGVKDGCRKRSPRQVAVARVSRAVDKAIEIYIYRDRSSTEQPGPISDGAGCLVCRCSATGRWWVDCYI